MTKRYKLLKDMPGIKSGSEVRWSKATGGYRYFAPDHFIVPHNFEDDMRDTIRKDLVENTPDWFQEIKEPERIEVAVYEDPYSSRRYHINDKGRFYPYRLEIYATETPSLYGKIPAIKQAIENVLNDNYTTMYTQEQMDEAIKASFEAAKRVTDKKIGTIKYYSGGNWFVYEEKYPDIQDYLSSLKK